MIGKPIRQMPPLVALALLMAACGDPTSSDTAQVSLALTDNPGDVKAVWVEIGEIYLQGGGEQGRVTLVSEADAAGLGLVELTELAGTTLDLVENVEITPGNYGQMRFVVDGAVLETEDGDVYTFNASHPDGKAATGSLTCPSCGETGIKVLMPGEVGNLEAGAHLLVLDFDVSQSFGRQAGASGMWVMSPVIRVAEFDFSGTISGTVVLGGDPVATIPECPAGSPRDITSFIPEALAQTLTVDDEQVVVTAVVAADGSFSFQFLEPDDYDLGFVESVDFEVEGVTGTLTFVADAPGVVNVGLDDNVGVEYTITSATCS